ncbi:MAG: class I SAM-dependent methyltransferase [Pseudonocardia sp.]|nr:class I SAM-dependent methyltransferase [Pseudonocardia sp.]
MAHQHQHQHQHPAQADDPGMIEILDLDAELLQSHMSALTAWIREVAGDRPPRRILDLGSGTGTGSFALLRRFPEAETTAVDASDRYLHHLTERAAELGLADRVRTQRVDLDAAWPDLDPVDLVWASASLHHMADPDRVLRHVAAALRPGGLLVLAEMDSFPRFLPDDLGLGRPGLETRIRAALAHRHETEVPHLGADWGPRVTAAGLTLEAEQTFPIDLRSPLPAAAGRYARAGLVRMRSALTDRLDADDLTVLDALLDDAQASGVVHRDDLNVRTTRTVWMARRM